MIVELREEVLVSGEGLVGVLGLPGQRSRTDAPVVIVLNAGNMHRVGVGRSAVTLTRALNDAGHATLRFDHSGVGDSPPLRSTDGHESSRVSEICHVMSELHERLGCSRFILYGLCSGARDAYHAALADDRVVGIVQIDGFAYRNFRYHLTWLGRRLLDPARLVRSIARRLGSAPASKGDAPADQMWAGEWSDYPPRREVEAGYAKLVARGVRLFVVFTGSWIDEYNYANQFLDMYSSVDFGDALTLRHLPEANHTLTNPVDRRAVLGDVTDWVRDVFAGDGEAVS